VSCDVTRESGGGERGSLRGPFSKSFSIEKMSNFYCYKQLQYLLMNLFWKIKLI
jgi:hypothetical protein